jgi:hypothetical protein
MFDISVYIENIFIKIRCSQKREIILPGISQKITCPNETLVYTPLTPLKGGIQRGCPSTRGEFKGDVPQRGIFHPVH